LKRRNSPESFKEKGENIRAAIKEAINDVGISADVTGLFNNPGLHIDLPDESLRPKVNTLFIQEMAKRGIHTTGRFMATLAHTDEDIRATAEAARESLKVVRNGLEGNLDDLLEAHEQRESIQRIVR
jgi:glutamate-1-semialdehyde aminotransferase